MNKGNRTQAWISTKPSIALWIGGGWTWVPIRHSMTDYWSLEWLLFHVSVHRD